MAQDIVEGLRAMAHEFRVNAERSISVSQQSGFAGRARVIDDAADEIERLRTIEQRMKALALPRKTM